MDEHTPHLLEKTRTAPRRTGVYLMKDTAGKVLYVGKAKNLHSRVRSYFASRDTRPMIPFMVPRVQDIDFIITENEKEALILENTLIKEHRPRYNVFFRDDKDYYHLRLDLSHPFPRFQFIRRPRKDGAVYFGPYSSGQAVKETMHFLQRVFPLRTCKEVLFKSRQRPCLEHEIRRCLGPCCGLVSPEKYGELVRDAVQFLEGKEKTLVRSLREKMAAASARLDFEEAARLRDIVSAIEATLEKQNVFDHAGKNQDIFGVHREGGRTQVCAVRVRQGRIQGTKKFPLFRIEAETGEILSSVMKQFYEAEPDLPGEILIPEEIEDRAVMSEWLSEKRGGGVAILVPQRGKKRSLLEMARSNAENMYKSGQDSEEQAAKLGSSLAAALHLKKAPRVIECFDISNMGGDQAVGSMVTFIDGEPEKNRYRRFRIRDVQGADDFAMIYEVLKRRLVGDLELPDLIIVDGGKGQLNSALFALREAAPEGAAALDMIGLAKAADDEPPVPGQKVRKGEDRSYIAGRKDPVYLSKYPRALLFLQRIRDEAHRFAVSYHRLLMRKRDLHSVLDEIPGVGPARKKALLERFRSVADLKKAGTARIAELAGISPELAAAIVDFLHREYPEGPGADDAAVPE